MSYVLSIVLDNFLKQLHTEYSYVWWTVYLAYLSSGKYSKHKKNYQCFWWANEINANPWHLYWFWLTTSQIILQKSVCNKK